MKFTDREAIHLIVRYGEVCKSLIKQLRKIKENLQSTKHHQNVRISNTAGSISGAVGSALVIAGIATAPFTLGISSILSIVGLSIGSAGAVTSTGAIIGDYVVTKKYIEMVEKAMKERNELAEHMECLFQFIEDFSKYDNNDVTNAAFNMTAKGMGSCTKIIGLVTSIRAAVEGVDKTANIGLPKMLFTIRPLVKVTAPGKAIVTAGQSSAIAIKSISVLGHVAIGFISAFAVIDLGLTLWSWTKPHTVVTRIDEIIEQLKQSIDICKDMLSAINSQEVKMRNNCTSTSNCNTKRLSS